MAGGDSGDMCVLVQLWTFGSLPIIALGLALVLPSTVWYARRLPLKRKPAVNRNHVAAARGGNLPVCYCRSSTSHMGQNPMSLNLLLIAAVLSLPYRCCVLPPLPRACVLNVRLFPVHWPDADVPAGCEFYGEKPGADKMVTFAFIWVGWQFL